MAAKIPTHEATYARIRDMVLHGALAPGEAVTIQGLVTATGAGMTPVREALRRLTAEGALVPLGNRRIAVPRMSEAALDEIAFARLTIEPRLVRMAAPRLDRAAVAQLTEIDAALDAAIAAGDVGSYLRENHRFHFSLYAAADSAVLERLAATLWLRIAPSLRVVCGGAAGLPDRHRDALAALRREDGVALEEAIRADIAEGVAHVRAALVATPG